MSKLLKYSIFIIVVIISLFLFTALNSSTKAKRSAEQKLFDDFSGSLNSLYLENTRLPNFNETKSSLPTFRIDLILKTANGQNANYNFSLDWNDLTVVKKGLRILELLSLANIFSTGSKPDKKNFGQISLTTSNGYNFNAYFDEISAKNSSLSLAIVLLKD